jgi:hypothetical protein
MAGGSQKLTDHELGICEFYSLKIDLYGMDIWRSLQKVLEDSDRNKSNPEWCFVVRDSHMTTCAANQTPNLKVERGEDLCMTDFIVL